MDRKQLTTALAAVGILLIAGILGLRLWANAARNAMPQLSMVHVGPDGRIYTVLADTLYWEDADGGSLGSLPLSRLGISGFWGDFAVLSDGDLILPASKQPADSVQKEVRIAMSVPASGDAGPDAVPLTRCSLQTDRCAPLTGTPRDAYFRADRTFKLAVDEAAGRLYVADTAAQRLLILDLQGRILAKQTTGFAFPNQLELAAPGSLKVADTNNNRVLTLAVGGDAFAEPPVSNPVEPWSHSLSHQYPVGLTQDGKGRQWVVLTDAQIRNGALYRLDGVSGAKRMALPEGSDVLFLAATDREVLAADGAHYAIHAFDMDGNSLPEVGSGPLAAALAGYAGQRRLYDAVFDYSLVALMVIGGLLFFLLWLSRLYPQGDAPATAVEGSGPLPEAGVRTPAMAWRGTEYRFRRRLGGIVDKSSQVTLYIILAALFALPIALIVSLQRDLARKGHPFDAAGFFDDPRLYLVAVLLVIMAVYLLLARRYERLAVGHDGIRYASWVAGPVAFLAPLYPGWQFRWDDLADIRLVAGGTRPMLWYFQFTLKQGGVRRLGAFTWREVDQEDETGLSLRDLMQRDPVRFKAALSGTRLFALLELAVRARKQQFQNPLMG